MKYLIKISALVLGCLSSLTITSCKKEEANQPKLPMHECCEWTDSFGDSYKYCEEDAPIYGYDWEQIKAIATAYGADCGMEPI